MRRNRAVSSISPTVCATILFEVLTSPVKLSSWPDSSHCSPCVSTHLPADQVQDTSLASDYECIFSWLKLLLPKTAVDLDGGGMPISITRMFGFLSQTCWGVQAVPVHTLDPCACRGSHGHPLRAGMPHACAISGLCSTMGICTGCGSARTRGRSFLQRLRAQPPEGRKNHTQEEKQTDRQIER